MLYDSDKGINSLTSILGTNASSGTSNKELIIYVLGSRRIIENMLLTSAYFQDKDDLMINHYARILGLDTVWKEDPMLKNYIFKKKPDPQFVDFQDSLLGRFVSTIASHETFDIDMKSWKMTMSYKNEDEHFAKVLVIEQIASLCYFYIIRKKVKCVEAVNFLQQKKDSLAEAMRGATMALANWKDSNRRLITAAGDAEEARFKQTISILVSSFSESSRQLEMAKLTLLDESPIVQTIDTPKYPLPRAVSSNWKLIASIVSLAGFILITLITVGQKLLSDYLKKQKIDHQKKNSKIELID